MKSITNVVLVVVFLVGTYHIVGQLGTGDLFGFQYKGREVDIRLFALIVSTTFFGAVVGSLYGILDLSTDNESKWWNQLLSGISQRRFGMSLLATPLVVFIVFDQMISVGGDASISLFCFQSGFFWDRTLRIFTPVAAKTERKSELAISEARPPN
jgi:uncharacterized membrane protein YfcA